MLHQPPSAFTPPPPSNPAEGAARSRDAIRAHCARAGLTPTAVARAAGVVPSTLNRFLAGRTAAPKGDTLVAIAVVLERAAPTPKAAAPAPAAPAGVTDSPALAVLEHIDTIRADALGRPIFDVPAYVAAMRGAGAVLRPIRGKPGSAGLEDLLIEIIEGADSPAVKAVEQAFAERRLADPVADGRTAQFLFAETSIARFRKTTGSDPAAMLRELKRLDTLARDAGKLEADCLRACGEDESNPLLQKAMLLADETGEAYHNPVLDLAARPIATPAQAGLKIALALAHFRDEVSREQLLRPPPKLRRKGPKPIPGNSEAS